MGDAGFDLPRGITHRRDVRQADLGYGYSGWWSTRTAYDTVENWELTTKVESMGSGVDGPYGIAVEPDESRFYVVGSNGAVGVIVDDVYAPDLGFSIPGAHLLDISLAR